MTLVAVWKFSEHRVHAVADTRISRDAENVLTDHGPKILPLTVVCKTPGPSGFFDQETYRIEYGFAFAGATLPAFSAHALANVLCGNLVGYPETASPSMEDAARLVGAISLHYIKETGQLGGLKGGFFESILFGHCPCQKRPLAFKFIPSIETGAVTLRIERWALDENEVVIIGSKPDRLEEEIGNIRSQRDLHPINFSDAPMNALRKLVREETIAGVGGTIQQAWSIPYKLEIVATSDGIEPALRSGRNFGLFVLGFDIIDMQQVGGFKVSLPGR